MHFGSHRSKAAEGELHLVEILRERRYNREKLKTDYETEFNPAPISVMPASKTFHTR